MKKSIVTVSLVLSLIVSASAQKWVAMMEDPRVNFYDVQKEFYSYYVGKTLSEKSEPRMDGPYTRFKEWERTMLPRVYPTGIRPDPQQNYKEWQRLQAKSRLSNSAANWTFIGPSDIPSNGGGAGKVNCIVLDPVNPQKVWIGTAGGGIWKSDDAGASWSTNTDNQLPSLGILSMAIDPVNTANLYASVLEGLFKSTDSGATWQLSGLNKPAYSIAVDPVNAQILIASSDDGMYRSTDGGATWTQTTTTIGAIARTRDIKFNPANSNVVYAVGWQNIFRSTDNGQSWSESDSGLATGIFGIKIAVTPANPNYLYALTTGYGSVSLGGFYGLYRSSDQGLTWTLMSTTPNILGYDPTGALDGGQGAYCMSLAASPINADEIIAGGINLWKSVDGGTTWTLKSEWNGNGAPYVHADQQALLYQSGNVLYAGNDGGVNISTDGGDNWTDLSDGLGITQFYKMSSSNTDPDMMVAGAQDNGTTKINGGVSDRINVADGMDCLVDYTDSNTIYTSYQYGAIYRSYDGGLTGTFISPSSGSSSFIDFSMNPLNHHTLYTAYDDAYRSYDDGTTWTNITNGLYQTLGGGYGIPIQAAPSDTNVIYIGRLTNLYRTVNGGATWNLITTGVIANALITGMVIDPSDANKVWVTYSGYGSYAASNSKKVMKTTDGGATWTDITYTGLPAASVNCIVYQNGTPDALYVGTDLGVYYTDNTMSSWIPYNTGLPNAKVYDMDIQYTVGKLRAATFGRGIWESDLNVPVIAANDAGILSIQSPPATTCSNSITPIVELRNFGSSVITSVTINYQIDGGPVTSYNWSGSLASFTSDFVTLPSATIAQGPHTITITTDLPNGIADQNNANDQQTTSFDFPLGITLPYSEGFENPVFPPTGITINNPDTYTTWQRSQNASYSGVASAYINDRNYYNDGMIDEIVLPYFDLTGTNPFLTFEYAYQLQFNPFPVNNYSDTLEVDVSTDCGDSWTVVYKKYDLPLVTTAVLYNDTSNFIPASSADWRLESI
ncbi:MAG: hypothetical protein U0X76_05660 [Bacteroidia bacterium]